MGMMVRTRMSDEERREHNRETQRQWYVMNRERLLAKSEARRRANGAKPVVKLADEELAARRSERERQRKRGPLTLEQRKRNRRRAAEKRAAETLEQREARLEKVREKKREYDRRYRKQNGETISERKRKWFVENQKEMTKKQCERRRTDPQFKLAAILRTRLGHAIRGRSKNGSAVHDLGCTIEELKAHLESLFQPDMSWDNFGRIPGVKCWEVDHITPLSSFDLTIREQFLQAAHYTNLQPLWAIDNMRKGAKIPA